MLVPWELDFRAGEERYRQKTNEIIKKLAVLKLN